MRRFITIVTYNVRHCLGLPGKVDLYSVVQTLRDAASIDTDCNERSAEAVVICLQELDTLNPRSGFGSQGHEIAKQLCLKCFPANALSFFEFFGFGNAILTNVPVHSTWNRFLPWSGGELRKVQSVRIGRNDCRVDIYNTHLGLKQNWRLKSADHCATMIGNKSKAIPVIFCGDFNAEIDSIEMQSLTEKSGLKSVGQEETIKTYPSDNPRKRIDHILVSKQFGIDEARTVASAASDHLPLVARLCLES